jgi:hypothetical protein
MQHAGGMNNKDQQQQQQQPSIHPAFPNKAQRLLWQHTYCGFFRNHAVWQLQASD